MALIDIETALQAACTAAQWHWLCDQLVLLNDSQQPRQDLAIMLAMARRKVGSDLLNAEGALRHWRCDEAARVCLLAKAQQREAGAVSLVKEAYQQGDQYEREAIIKGLSLLDRQGALLVMAEEACRSNIVSLFAAICHNNDYPQRHFSEGTFNQMVLKSLFVDLNIEGIIGLDSRANPALSRMCYDYLRERKAANRAVPVSIWLSINLEWTPEATEDLIQCFDHGDERERYYAALSLSRQRLTQCIIHSLQQHIDREPSLAVRQYLSSYLSQP